MRPTETRCSCLALLAILACGEPVWSQGAQEPIADAPVVDPTQELLAQTRACRDWFSDTARRPQAQAWANDAQFRGCRQVIADALAHLDAREQGARGQVLASLEGARWERSRR